MLGMGRDTGIESRSPSCSRLSNPWVLELRGDMNCVAESGNGFSVNWCSGVRKDTAGGQLLSETLVASSASP